MSIFNFDGERDRVLRYTPFSARRFKESYGKPLWKVQMIEPGEQMPEMVDSVCLTQIIWAGLLPTEPKTTFNDAERLLDSFYSRGGDLKDLNAAVSAALRESGLFGKWNEEKDPNEQA